MFMDAWKTFAESGYFSKVGQVGQIEQGTFGL